jgi:hypothetical protein
MTETLQQVLTSPHVFDAEEKLELVVELLSWVNICSGEVRTCCRVSVMGKYLFRRS